LTDLVRRAQRGDMDAFEALVITQTASIYRLARAYVGDAAAPDLVQDVFVAAWRALPKLRDPAVFGPWLHRIAVNRCRSAVRDDGRVREIPMDEMTADRSAHPGDGFAAVEARAVVGPAFRRLGGDQRAVIALHYAAGLSIRECGEALGIPEGTAKSRLNAALETLRRDVGRARP
jgi:RNA polymerase sigma-70 factor (ECF subfamily)